MQGAEASEQQHRVCNKLVWRCSVENLDVSASSIRMDTSAFISFALRAAVRHPCFASLICRANGAQNARLHTCHNVSIELCPPPALKAACLHELR